MFRPLVIGGSIGLLCGVLIGTVGGSAIMEEVIAQMIFGLIAGLGGGVCYHILTREKKEGESFLPPSGAQSNADAADASSPEGASGTANAGSGNKDVLVWLLPLIALLFAAIKGFMVGSSLGR